MIVLGSFPGFSVTALSMVMQGAKWSNSQYYGHRATGPKKSGAIKSGTYVIENKYTGLKYVGRSSNINKRIAQHNAGTGAKWTQQSGRGWELVKAYKGNTNAMENAVAKGVIRNEGFANVRGGSYSQPSYAPKTFRAIKVVNGFTNNGVQNNK